MAKGLKKLNAKIDALALKAVMLEPDDIPALGEVLKELEAMEGLVPKRKGEPLLKLMAAMKAYLEKVILFEQSDLGPIEQGITLFQEIGRELETDKEISTDISTVLAGLETDLATGDGAQTESAAAARQTERSANETPPLTDEDREIVADFVSESLENLGSIEVNLMDLEQDPSDLETINAIFRPFHTIKGVSGFLNFNKINHLAHAAENLLDKSRNRELQIDEAIIDIILSSVDLLRQMIENVQDTLNSERPNEGDLDISLQIDNINRMPAFGDKKEERRLGEILVAREALSQNDLAEALDFQKVEQDRRLGEILIGEKKVKADRLVSALREQKRVMQPITLQVKIDTVKLDNVVDMVGELAIAQSMLRQNENIKSNSSRKLDHIINQLNQITSGLQKTAMSLRMVPIQNTFQKMLRLVRDLARKADKEVRLEMSGQETEIDRNMVEEIYEPMVHLIRNAVDHGMEPPDERERLDKARQGTINLRAYHKGGDIVIEIEDDGRGLDKDKILTKAVARGLVKADEQLSENEIYNFIFHAGFSTADKVTDISGRGVGMDVVKNKIVERLRGRIEIQSKAGRGTTLVMRLPLTLAILDGMVVELDQSRYIIPTLSVQESFRPKRETYQTLKGEGEMIKVRNALVPLIRLDKLLKLNGNGNGNGKGPDTKTPWERLVVVVENQERRACLLIDELLGQEEVVIKSLGESFKSVKGIAGGAIMGDGRISLILDIAGIFDIMAGAS